MDFTLGKLDMVNLIMSVPNIPNIGKFGGKNTEEYFQLFSPLKFFRDECTASPALPTNKTDQSKNQMIAFSSLRFSEIYPSF